METVVSHKKGFEVEIVMLLNFINGSNNNDDANLMILARMVI